MVIIIKSKRKGSICGICHKKIDLKYKVEIRSGWENTTHHHYHLSCFLRHLKAKLESTKKQLKQFSKQKYRRQMILESL